MQVSPGFTVSECGYLSLATCTLLRRTSWCVYPDARTLRPLLPLEAASASKPRHRCNLLWHGAVALRYTYAGSAEPMDVAGVAR